MKPSVSQVSASSTESAGETSVELIPLVFFILGILLAASFLQVASF